jgi:hypothetical protein
MGEKQDEDWYSYDSFIYHTEQPITSQNDLDRLKSVIKKKTKVTKNTVKEIAVSEYMPSNCQQLRIKVSFMNRVFFLLRGFKHTFYIPDIVLRELY